MEWMLAVSLAVLLITAAFVLHMTDVDYGIERFMNENAKAEGSIGLAEFGQGLPLADFLTVQTGVTPLGASDCADADSARQMELGGQYVQRTNNYRREYPDHCSSLRSDFVGGFYQPKEGGVGLGVPCDGV
jgi:hypothetical protein